MDWQVGFQLRGARSDQATRPVKSQPGERGTRPNPGENNQERTGTKLNRTPHGENWKTQPSREPQKFPRGKAPLDPTVNRQIQRRKKSPLPRRDSAEATDLNRNGMNEQIRPGERKRSPGADPSDNPSTRKRDEWKASTRSEGDSKAPSASIATSTCICRKAGARGKHTGNVITTPGSVRGEEERLEQAPGNRPEERMGPQDTASLACHRQSRGRATQKLKEETTRWEEPLQLPVPEPWSANDSKGKGKGKWETSSQAAAPTSH